jgi:NAD(P)-dependent dehydrogenase (short-subunit alcohol dehydrogenase family)
MLESDVHAAALDQTRRKTQDGEASMDGRKAIFITGGASGIGKATALHFARKGWFVGLADVNEAGLAETVKLLPEGQGDRKSVV